MIHSPPLFEGWGFICLLKSYEANGRAILYCDQDLLVPSDAHPLYLGWSFLLVGELE